MRCIAKIYGQSSHKVGSAEKGMLADLILWGPAFFWRQARTRAEAKYSRIE